MSGNGFVDVIVLGINKVIVFNDLFFFWGFFGVDLIVFGDGGNDVEMFKFVKFGYVMKNVGLVVIVVVNYCMVFDNNYDGVLVVLEDYFIN